jgi:hypothetical protein
MLGGILDRWISFVEGGVGGSDGTLLGVMMRGGGSCPAFSRRGFLIGISRIEARAIVAPPAIAPADRENGFITGSSKLRGLLGRSIRI